jgi:hypothetical protein
MSSDLAALLKLLSSANLIQRQDMMLPAFLLHRYFFSLWL